MASQVRTPTPAPATATFSLFMRAALLQHLEQHIHCSSHRPSPVHRTVPHTITYIRMPSYNSLDTWLTTRNMQACTHLLIVTHTTHVTVHAHTCTHTHMHACGPVHACRHCGPVLIQACTRARTRTCTRTRTLTCTCTCTCTRHQGCAHVLFAVPGFPACVRPDHVLGSSTDCCRTATASLPGVHGRVLGLLPACQVCMVGCWGYCRPARCAWAGAGATAGLPDVHGRVLGLLPACQVCMGGCWGYCRPARCA